MTGQTVLLLVIVGAALVLFSWERFPADVVALGVLIALVLAGLLPADRAFASFGSDAVVMIFGLLVLTAALSRTGVVDMAARAVLRRAGDRPGRLVLLIMVGAAALSSLASNTAATALFLPVTLGLARRAKISPSKLLMPLAFASILASSVTLVSSSTNIVVSGLMTQAGLPPLGMFELTLVGIPIAVVGLLYMLLLGDRLVTDRRSAIEPDGRFVIRPYLTEVLVLPGSPLIGRTLAQSGLGHDLDLTVLQVVRGGSRQLVPRADLQLQERDVLLVEGQRDDILKVKDSVGIAINADIELSDPELQNDEVRLAEAILLPRSPLVGRTLRGVNFRQRFGLQVLGVNRHGATLLRKISQIVLRTGDQILVQGPSANIAVLDESNVIRVLGTVMERRPNVRRAPIAIGIFVVTLAVATMKIVSLPVAVLLGVLAAFVTRCITPEEAYREVEWKALIVIGCMLAVGSAMEYTGTAQFLAGLIVDIAGQLHPLWLLSSFFALTLLLTQPLSNQAAAVVVTPIAFQTALQAGLNPRTFAVTVAVAASCSFITPLEPSCLIVYGPGQYRFIDFARVGSPLTVLIYLLVILLVPLMWPL